MSKILVAQPREVGSRLKTVQETEEEQIYFVPFLPKFQSGVILVPAPLDVDLDQKKGQELVKKEDLTAIQFTINALRKIMFFMKRKSKNAPMGNAPGTASSVTGENGAFAHPLVLTKTISQEKGKEQG